jgi:predicted HTH domain antitoxin
MASEVEGREAEGGAGGFEPGPSADQAAIWSKMVPAMDVTIRLPEDISESLEGRWGNVPRHALETIAVEGYRTGALTESQVRRLLGYETRFDVHALLKEHKVPLNYTEADLEEDLAAHRDLGFLARR